MLTIIVSIILFLLKFISLQNLLRFNQRLLISIKCADLLLIRIKKSSDTSYIKSGSNATNNANTIPNKFPSWHLFLLFTFVIPLLSVFSIIFSILLFLLSYVFIVFFEQIIWKFHWLVTVAFTIKMFAKFPIELLSVIFVWALFSLLSLTFRLFAFFIRLFRFHVILKYIIRSLYLLKLLFCIRLFT